MRGSWMVQYTDGTMVGQYDRQHPMYTGEEVPLRAIDWLRVHKLRFESQLAATSLEVPQAPDGLAWSLRYRTWMRMDSTSCSAFLLVLSAANQEVTADTTKYVLFWYPDGTTYETPEFMSRETNEYGSGIIHDMPVGLVSSTNILRLAGDAITLYRPVLL